MFTFLQLAGLNSDPNTTMSVWDLLPPDLKALLITLFISSIVIMSILYIYTSLAFVSIGKKVNLKSPGIAWINPIVSIFEISGMHWWPWPALFLGTGIGSLFMLASSTISEITIYLVALVFTVMSVIWQWKTFEAVSKPGWWALVAPIIAILGIALSYASLKLGGIIVLVSVLAYLVLIGIAAWSKPEVKTETI